MELPLYQGTQHATSRVPQKTIDPQHPMASLWQRSAAVASQAAENIEQALIDRQEFTLQQNREAQLRQSMDELNAELAQRLSLADGAPDSLFNSNGQLIPGAVTELKKRYGRISNTWTKGFINPHSSLAASEAQQKYLNALASRIDSTILASLKPRALNALKRNAAAAVAAGEYDNARAAYTDAARRGLITDEDAFLSTTEIDDEQKKKNLQDQADALSAMQGDPDALEDSLYDPRYADFYQRNPDAQNKVRKILNSSARNTPSSPGGFRVVKPQSAQSTYSSGPEAGANTVEPHTPDSTSDAPAAPADDTADTTAAPAGDETETATPISETGEWNINDGTAPPMEYEHTAPAEASDTDSVHSYADAPDASAPLPPEYTTDIPPEARDTDDTNEQTEEHSTSTQEDAASDGEETVTSVGVAGTPTGRLAKQPKPKVVKDLPKPPVGADAFTRAHYAHHAADFTTPDAQRDATIYFQTFLAKQPLGYLDDPANVAYAQAYGKQTLHIPEDSVNALIKARKDELSTNIPAFNPSDFLSSSLTRWQDSYDRETAIARMKADFANTPLPEDEEEAQAVKATRDARIANLKAYNMEQGTQLKAIHHQTLQEYYNWKNSLGVNANVVQQAAAFQKIYKANLDKANFKHRKGLGFENGDANTYLHHYTSSPAIATAEAKKKHTRAQMEAEQKYRATEAFLSLTTPDFDPKEHYRRSLAAYATESQAGGEIPAEILTSNSDDAVFARTYTDAALSRQSSLACSIKAQPAYKSRRWKDSKDKHIVYLPQEHAKNEPLYAKRNYLMPMNDGTCLNIELRPCAEASVATPSCALAARLGYLGYQYNTLTFDNNQLHFSNRSVSSVSGGSSSEFNAADYVNEVDSGGSSVWEGEASIFPSDDEPSSLTPGAASTVR